MQKRQREEWEGSTSGVDSDRRDGQMDVRINGNLQPTE